jgi:hypothetical protein
VGIFPRWIKANNGIPSPDSEVFFHARARRSADQRGAGGIAEPNAFPADPIVELRGSGIYAVEEVAAVELNRPLQGWKIRQFKKIAKGQDIDVNSVVVDPHPRGVRNKDTIALIAECAAQCEKRLSQALARLVTASIRPKQSGQMLPWGCFSGLHRKVCQQRAAFRAAHGDFFAPTILNPEGSKQVQAKNGALSIVSYYRRHGYPGPALQVRFLVNRAQFLFP